ncbi:hypothetical protein PPERSA_12852 [Pseudocohnilembus persalinus]|uniref:Uncharacterized protein n=1 Tax=Pseudocohnilembus persalinus TaxID=266149 RepID=A0A0V0QUR4_PSEPJ|nr:hypothetical protein PPERSA_12852 [Pseudocohnilembus persalinus]|eukprot:KRX06163.1 hypothetical protein PPERSA_12852 [Pseudocohnilembus persalinus]
MLEKNILKNKKIQEMESPSNFSYMSTRDSIGSQEKQQEQIRIGFFGRELKQINIGELFSNLGRENKQNQIQNNNVKFCQKQNKNVKKIAKKLQNFEEIKKFEVNQLDVNMEINSYQNLNEWEDSDDENEMVQNNSIQNNNKYEIKLMKLESSQSLQQEEYYEDFDFDGEL